MGKDLDLNGGVGADIADLFLAQFPAEDHPLETPGSQKLHTGQGVDGHLGGAVQGDMGGDLLAKLHHTQILDDEGIHTGQGSLADQFRSFPAFPVRHQSI